MAETAIVAVTVSENSRNSRPMMPPISNSGMNTATSERLIEKTVKPISPEPFSAASNGVTPPRYAVDILHDHDGVVDHKAYRNGQRHQRDIVQAEPSRYMVAVVPSNESGTTTPGIRVTRKLRRNSRITSTTRTIVSPSVNSTS